jgi:hypothetical protein
MKVPALPLLSWLLSGVIWASLTQVAAAQPETKFIQEIKNKSATVTANDLTITFTDLVSSNPVIVAGGKEYPSSGGAGNTFKWPKGKLPEYSPGDVAAVRFESKSNTRIVIDDAQSFWTLDDAHIINSLGSIAQLGSFNFDGLGGVTATLTNASGFAIVYTGLQFYTNNAIGNFTLDGFDVPTGVLAGGLPSSLALDPGQSTSFSFGGASPGTYQLFLADVAAVSNPAETFRIGFGAAIPEPSSWALMLIGFGALGGAIRWRRKISRLALCQRMTALPEVLEGPLGSAWFGQRMDLIWLGQAAGRMKA